VGGVSIGTDVAGGTVEVDVEVDVGDVEATVTSAGWSAGLGFSHTEGDVGGPKVGNNVSRIAYAVPADPINVAAASAPTIALVDREFQADEPRSDGPTTSRAETALS